MLREPTPAGNGEAVDWGPGDKCPWCDRRHQSWRTLAACHWRRDLLWLVGNPPRNRPAWATVSRCRHPYPPGPMTTVILWEDRALAEQALADINRLGCGGACSRQHELVEMRAA